MLESLQKLLPWIIGLPTVPKVLITGMWVLLSITFMYLIWVPTSQKVPTPPSDLPAVKEAYSRMARTLARLQKSPDGHILVDGHPVEPNLTTYYSNYLAIEEFIVAHPNDIAGTYETIWDHGGGSRSFIDETQPFEFVVSRFFEEYSGTHTIGSIAPGVS